MNLDKDLIKHKSRRTQKILCDRYHSEKNTKVLYYNRTWVFARHAHVNAKHAYLHMYIVTRSMQKFLKKKNLSKGAFR